MTLAISIRQAVGDRNTWLGLLFAASGGAAFKSLEVIFGPFLVDRGFSEKSIGLFQLGPMIGLMIGGSLFGGLLTDRIGPRRCVAAALLFIAVTITGLALADRLDAEGRRNVLLIWLAATAFGIGVFTASSYALFMEITRPTIAATKIRAFMGATNGCESWSSYVSGRIIGGYSYSTAMLIMSAASLLALPLLLGLRRDTGAAAPRPSIAEGDQ